MAGDHYIPQHPLPEEIQSMEKDDTVCQFCGVSYLIHNEMKALLKRVEEAEKTMEHYKGSVEREEQLKIKVKELEEDTESLIKTLQASEERSKLFLQEISTKDKEINELNKAKQQLENKLLEMEKINSKLKSKVADFWHSYSNALKDIQRFKLDLTSLKTTYNVNLKGINDYCEGMVTHIGEMCMKVVKDVDIVKQQLKKVKSEKAELQNDCLKLQEKLSSSEKELISLEVSQRKASGLQTKYDEMQKETERYKEDVVILKEKVKEQLAELLKYKESEKMQYEEIDRLKKDLQSSQEALKKDKQKLQEIVINKEKEVYNIVQEQQQLKKQLNELNQTENERREITSASEQQLKTVRDSLSAAKAEIADLKDEREQMITAHQNRIEQLRESFKAKMNEADAWPDKFSKAMEELERKHQEQKDEMWKELNDSFQGELEQEQQRHADELNQWKKEAKNTQDKFKQDLSTMTRKHRDELRQLRLELDDRKREASNSKDSSSAIIANLEDKIQDLQSRLNKRSNASVDQVSLLRSQLNEFEQLNSRTDRQMAKLENELMDSRQQVEILQDTVRRECEERLELTDALSEARTQLLSLQRATKMSTSQTSLTSLTSVNSNSTLSNRGSSNSGTICMVGFDGIKKNSPLDSGRQSRSGSVDESRQRIYNALRRTGSKSRQGDSR